MTAPEGAGRFDHTHGDEDGIDIEPFMAKALDDVVDAILLFGFYPLPRSPAYKHLPARRIEFDLREWVSENVDAADLAEFFVKQITAYSSNDRDIRCTDEADKLEQRLRAELADSQIVRERAEQLAEEERDGNV